MRRLLFVVCAAFAMLAAAAPVHAGAEVSHSRLKGLSAFAFFSSTDPSGCISTSVVVAANDNEVSSGPGRPEGESTASVNLSRVDQCTGTLLLAANGDVALAPDDFQIDKQLDGAMLNSTVELSESMSGSPLTVELNLTWTGQGPTTTNKQRVQVKMPGFLVNSRIFGASRDATATGTVSDGTTNFTPEPATFASLVSAKSGTLIISRT